MSEYPGQRRGEGLPRPHWVLEGLCWPGVHPHALGRTNPNAPVEWGQDIRKIQELLGHKDVQITMIYTHVLNRGPLGVTSAADLL